MSYPYLHSHIRLTESKMDNVEYFKKNAGIFRLLATAHTVKIMEQENLLLYGYPRADKPEHTCTSLK